MRLKEELYKKEQDEILQKIKALSHGFGLK